MPIKIDSIFYDILNISKPWVISIMSYSRHQLRIDIGIDYNCNDIHCPVCAHAANVIGKIPITWRYLDIFQYQTHMTAYLPLIDSHNFHCRVDSDQALLNNILLLDLMVNQLKNTRALSPLHYLFNANGLGKN